MDQRQKNNHSRVKK